MIKFGWPETKSQPTMVPALVGHVLIENLLKLCSSKSIVLLEQEHYRHYL